MSNIKRQRMRERAARRRKQRLAEKNERLNNLIDKQAKKPLMVVKSPSFDKLAWRPNPGLVDIAKPVFKKVGKSDVFDVSAWKPNGKNPE